MGIAILSGVIESMSSQNVGTQKRSSSEEEKDDTSASEYLPNRFITCVSRPDSAVKLKNIWKGLGREDVEVRVSQNSSSVAESDVILLSCKPQLAKEILSERSIQDAISGKLVISILAGTTISMLKSFLPETTRVVRAMPNTPCQIREGMTVLSSLSSTCPYSSRTREILLSLFTPIGRCRFLDEKHFDACTALSGSGPAFLFLVLEAIADGGVMMGLPRSEALELAAQTMQGAARMVLQTGSHPASLKDRVTTPGGCTIAGLLALEDGRVRSTIARAIQTATLHAAGLGNSVNSNSKNSIDQKQHSGDQ
ncbi:pyrroline-5-carboxylate reductase dimerisation-domain-containing protein [Phakopsora pachyrhizi]|uniref:Pyrroline-5-carboxylate reductase n=1 Tax=Phakopsora pachyrhizi TaxID=170000 RepID=A0AAV0AIU8_PHAPC|nr:pyrroline-5-carboxylate reductase dimerisation-domain-containing protein [Phakopsora pachyrhizi]